MSTYIERKRENAAEMRQYAAAAKARGDYVAQARCMTVALRLEAHADAAEYRQQAANHRTHGHIEQAESAERCAAEADARAAEGV